MTVKEELKVFEYQVTILVFLKIENEALYKYIPYNLYKFGQVGKLSANIFSEFKFQQNEDLCSVKSTGIFAILKLG